MLKKEEHSQASLTIGMPMMKSDSKPLVKFEKIERKEPRILSSSSEDVGNIHIRRNKLESSGFKAKKTVDIKDRVTRKKIKTTDGNSSLSERSHHRN